MQLEGWHFDRLDDKHNELLRLVLKMLETLVDIKKADIVEVSLVVLVRQDIANV